MYPRFPLIPIAGRNPIKRTGAGFNGMLRLRSA